MKTSILIFFCFTSVSFAQEITENPLRMIGTNIFDFTPLIYALQHGEIANSDFLVSGRISQIDGNETKIVHSELRNQLSEVYAKQMLLASPGELLKMTYAAQLLEKWRKGQLSTGEFMSLDPESREIIYDEIEREKNDFVELSSFVKNLPTDYLVLGKNVKLLALPVGTSRFDYGLAVAGDANNFTNRFLITIRGYIKPRISKIVETNKINMPFASKN
jgi:hypothetical protein